MSAPLAIAHLTPAEVALFNDFHAAEVEAYADRRPLLEEMIAAIDAMVCRERAHMRAARAAWGSSFDLVRLRETQAADGGMRVLQAILPKRSQFVAEYMPEFAGARPKRRRA